MCYLLSVVLERQEANVSEQSLEDGGPYVGPIQHPLELGWVDHVAFESWQEYLGRVREHDHSKTDGKILYIYRPPHHAPTPVSDF